VKNGIGLVTAVQALPCFADEVVPNSETGGAGGEVRLIPDISTLRVLPFAPTRAACSADMFKVSYDGTLNPWSHCPRHFLKRQIKALADLGLAIKCSFEYEFSLFRKNANNELIALPGTFCNVLVENKYLSFVDDLTEALVAQGIQPELTHKEAGLGQLEFVLMYNDPLITADNHIVMRETLHAIAEKHGMVVSLLPKVSEGIGAGCHMHMSLWKDGKNITSLNSTGAFSPEAEHFVAGILANYPALMAFTTPSCNSYRRIKPGYWSGAYNVWGIFNKEAAIRVSGDTLGGIGNHWELKIVDATCNPYLAIGAVIVCGMDGLTKKTPLPPPTNAPPEELTQEERDKRHIVRLPPSVKEAIDHLKKNQSLMKALGDLSSSYIAVKLREAEYFGGKSLKEEVDELISTY
jgi:glutamine synthetase